MAVLIYEKWRDRPLSIKPVAVLFAVCILVSCFQAWVDEHRNSEQLKIEKAQVWGDAAFWKEQSYAKDDALRKRDEMLSKNFGVLSDTQNSLAQLSNKLLDTTKPTPTNFDVHRWQFPASYTFPDIGKVKLWVIVVTTNKTIPGVRGDDFLRRAHHFFNFSIADTRKPASHRDRPQGRQISGCRIPVPSNESPKSNPVCGLHEGRCQYQLVQL